MNEVTGVVTDKAKRETIVTRIFFGILCSIIVGAVTNLPYIKLAILWICKIVLLIFGNPEGVEKLKEKFEPTIHKGIEIAKKHDVLHGEGMPKVPILAAPIEIAKKAHAVEQGAKKLGDDIKETGDTIADALRKKKEEHDKKTRDGLIFRASVVDITPQDDWSLETLRITVTKAEEEKRQKDALSARAKAVKLDFDDAITSQELRPLVEEAERKWFADHGPNAACPFCRHQMRLSAHRKGELRCPQCNNIFSAARARAMRPAFAPPRPSFSFFH